MMSERILRSAFIRFAAIFLLSSLRVAPGVSPSCQPNISLKGIMLFTIAHTVNT
jgi:hypothetical protein